MFATVSSWRLTAPPATASGWDHFVRTLVGRGIQQARAMHVADMILVAIEPDQLMVVCQFETLDEARAAEQATLAFADEAYANEAELLTRSLGRVYEVGRYAQLGTSRERNDEAPKPAMFAQVVWWNLAPSVQEPHALDSFLKEAWGAAGPILQNVGLFDIVGVQTEPDTLVAFRLYSESTRVDQAFRTAVQRARDIFSSGAAPAAELTGRAWDTQILLDYLG